MDENQPEKPDRQHHSYWTNWAKPLIVILIGVVGGVALYLGVMAWYFTRDDPGGGPPGFGGGETKSSSGNVSVKQ